jgi:hypothetical protein
MLFSPDESDAWEWELASNKDIPEIVLMAEGMFQNEVEHIFTPDRMYLAYSLEIALTTQKYNKSQTLLTVARNKESNKLMAWAWLGRNGFTTYSRDEMAEAKFIHCDLTLSTRQRITIVAQAIQMWEGWCHLHKIPVLVSTTVRAEQKAFLKLHEQLGFTLRGSIAYKRITQ